MKFSDLNFIDLGLPSGTKWLDCFRSKLLLKTDFDLLSMYDFEYFCAHIPTIDQFTELKENCKIQKYKKGCYEFYIITGPNNNKIRLFESVWVAKMGLRLFNYWVIRDNNIKFYKNSLSVSSRKYAFSNIPAYSLMSTYIILPTNKDCANYLYVS